MKLRARLNKQAVTLDALPTQAITVTLPTAELREQFGLQDAEDLYERVVDWAYVDRDQLSNTVHLCVEEDGDVFLDRNDNVVPEEAVDALLIAASDALVSGTLHAMEMHTLETLKEMLDQFVDYPYEYWYYGDDGEEHASGVAKGFLSVDVKPETTTLVMSPDIVHVINDNISGVGEFGVVADLEGYSIEEYFTRLYHWLARYWEIYGDVKPSVDFDNVDGFDKPYFKELVREVEQQHGVAVLC